MGSAVKIFSDWALPVLLAVIPLYGYLRGVKVHEAFIEGAEEGLKVALKIVPFIVAMLVALGIFRSSGAMDLLIRASGPVLRLLGVPPEVVPLVIARPLSGAASLGILGEILRTYGPDSFIGRVASTMQGSTDTTFYILSVYFGSVGIRRSRYGLAVGLAGDAAGFLASAAIVRALFGR